MRHLILFLGMIFLSSPSEAFLSTLQNKLSAAKDHVHHKLIGGCSVNAQDLAKGLSGSDAKKVQKCALSAVRILHDPNARLHKSLKDLTHKYPEAGAVLEKIAADETKGYMPDMVLNEALQAISETKLKILAHLLSKHELKEEQWEEELSELEGHLSGHHIHEEKGHARHVEHTDKHHTDDSMQDEDLDDIEELDSLSHHVQHEHGNTKSHHAASSVGDEEEYVPRRRSRSGASSGDTHHDTKPHHTAPSVDDEEEYVPRRRSRSGASITDTHHNTKSHHVVEENVVVSPKHFAHSAHGKSDSAALKAGKKWKNITKDRKEQRKVLEAFSGSQSAPAGNIPPPPPMPSSLGSGGVTTHNKPSTHHAPAAHAPPPPPMPSANGLGRSTKHPAPAAKAASPGGDRGGLLAQLQGGGAKKGLKKVTVGDHSQESASSKKPDAIPSGGLMGELNKRIGSRRNAIAPKDEDADEEEEDDDEDWK